MTIEFNPVKGEESCEVISVSADEPITVNIKNVWAGSSEEGGNLRSYTYTASEHNININFVDTLIFEEAGIISVNVCLTGEDVGKYRGALIIEPDLEGQSGTFVQFAPWLFVDVAEPAPTNTDNNNNNNGNGGGGGGGTPALITSTETIKQTENENLEFEELSEDVGDEGGGGITGGTISEEGKSGIRFLNLIPVIFIVAIIAASIYVNRRRKKQFGY